MKHNSLVNALTKAGIEVIEHERTDYRGDRADSQFSAEGNGHVATWYVQVAWDKPGTLSVQCLNVRRENDHTDLMTDYFAGYFPETIKATLHDLTVGGESAESKAARAAMVAELAAR